MKKFLSLMMVAVIASITISSAVFAITVNALPEFGGGSLWHDTVTDSNGDVHLVDALLDVGQQTKGLVYRKYTASTRTWGSPVTILAQDGNHQLIHGKIDVDSNDIPGVIYGVSYFDSTDPISKYVKATNSAGTSWGTVYDIYSGYTDTSMMADFKFRPSDDYPIIAGMVDDGGSGWDYSLFTWNGSGFTKSDIETTVNDVAVDVSLEIISSDYHFFTTPGLSSDEALYYYYDGSWNTGTSPVTGMTGHNDHRINSDIGAGNKIRVVYNHVGPASKEILFRVLSGGSWSGEPVAQGLTINTRIVDVVNTGGKDYVIWHDEDTVDEEENPETPALRYADSSNSGETWTVRKLTEDIEPFIGISYATITESRSDSSELLVTAANFWSSGSVNNYSFYLSSLTGGGESVPEFSTYVYIGMILVAFGILYYGAPKVGIEKT